MFDKYCFSTDPFAPCFGSFYAHFSMINNLYSLEKPVNITYGPNSQTVQNATYKPSIQHLLIPSKQSCSRKTKSYDSRAKKFRKGKFSIHYSLDRKLSD